MNQPGAHPIVWVHKDGRAIIVQWGQGPQYLLEREHPEEIEAIHPTSRIDDFRRMHARPPHEQRSPEEWLTAARTLFHELGERIVTGEGPPIGLYGKLTPDERLAELLKADEEEWEREQTGEPPPAAPKETDPPPDDQKPAE